jgi:hypothetical protein
MPAAPDRQPPFPATASAMPPSFDTDAQCLLKFNRDVLDQALALVAAHEVAGAPAYAGPVGSHLRHVIEHYEALIFPACHGVVNYDSRPRDVELERSAQVARARLLALLQRLLPEYRLSLDEPLSVRGKGGPGGEFDFTVGSTIGRELVFAASHAVHHFALLKAHCQQQGISVGANFGKAPATVAHERDGPPRARIPECAARR